MAIISSRPSVALVKTRWRKKGPRTLAERAGVIGANVWKISLEIFKHMEKEGFRFGSGRVHRFSRSARRPRGVRQAERGGSHDAHR
jgi:hypothetical protein